MTTVLIISTADDWSAEQVADQLALRGVRHIQVDLGDFPQRMGLVAELGQDWHGHLGSGADLDVNLTDVTAVFYRRPTDFDLAAGMSGPERHFAKAQARIGLGGILASLPARWINHPSTLADAEYKPRQLAVAAGLEMAVPPTLITNRAEAVREFASRCGELIVKPLAEPIIEEAGTYTPVWTRRVTEAELARLTRVETTAHLFQRWIPKAYEVRLTVVGAQLFPVAIHASSEHARVDWRSDHDALTYRVIDCPPAIADQVIRFLEVFGLCYGAFDFVVTEEGRWIFLECNGAGQWGWLAEECGLPIAAAIAAELTKE